MRPLETGSGGALLLVLFCCAQLAWCFSPLLRSAGEHCTQSAEHQLRAAQSVRMQKGARNCVPRAHSLSPLVRARRPNPNKEEGPQTRAPVASPCNRSQLAATDLAELAAASKVEPQSASGGQGSRHFLRSGGPKHWPKRCP